MVKLDQKSRSLVRNDENVSRSNFIKILEKRYGSNERISASVLDKLKKCKIGLYVTKKLFNIYVFVI